MGKKKAPNPKGHAESLASHAFPKGVSGNPSGKPKGFAEFRAWCRDHSDEAGKTLLENLGDPEGPVRNKAAEIIWAYAWGKPTQAVEVSGRDGEPIKAELAVAYEPPSPEELAAILHSMAGAGALPASGGAEAASEGTDAEADEVLGALPDAAPGGIPSP